MEGRRSLISVRLQMLISLFNKKISSESLEALTRVYCTALENFPERSITQGFNNAEQALERFPTPKILRELCNKFAPSNVWKYHFKPGKARDPETGEEVDILIDPDPAAGKSNQVFRPQDCPEGRRFLAKLKE